MCLRKCKKQKIENRKHTENESERVRGRDRDQESRTQIQNYNNTLSSVHTMRSSTLLIQV